MKGLLTGVINSSSVCAETNTVGFCTSSAQRLYSSAAVSTCADQVEPEGEQASLWRAGSFRKSSAFAGQ